MLLSHSIRVYESHLKRKITTKKKSRFVTILQIGIIITRVFPYENSRFMFDPIFSYSPARDSINVKRVPKIGELV